MNAFNPNIIEGETYPLYSANLAITSFYKNGGDFDVSACLKLIPTRLDAEGNVDKKELFSKSLLIGSVNEMSVEERAAMDQIYAAIQNYINVKGL